MKQLISQSKIDEAAKEYLYKEAGMERYSEPMITKRIFKCGVQFALKEIEPLMVEFAEFIISSTRIMNLKTTKQLLEEFINSKNKENE